MSEQNGALRELVARARAAHARLTVDVITVTRHTLGALNESTGQYAETTTTPYAGAARLKRAMAEDQVTGDRERQVATDILVLPFSVTGADALHAGDTVHVDESSDPALQGKTLTVLGPEHGTTVSAHRYRLEEVSL